MKPIMVNKGRASRYFSHQGKIYKMLYISRPTNKVYCWDYEDRRRVLFIYSQIQKEKKPVFTTFEVAKMVNRRREALTRYINEGHIRRPPQTYTLDGQFKPSKYLWSEKEIMELHDYLITIHKGRPRKDGIINPHPTPTRSELLALIRNDVMYYVDNEKGEKVKVFKETVW